MCELRPLHWVIAAVGTTRPPDAWPAGPAWLLDDEALLARLLWQIMVCGQREQHLSGKANLSQRWRNKKEPTRPSGNKERLRQDLGLGTNRSPLQTNLNNWPGKSSWSIETELANLASFGQQSMETCRCPIAGSSCRGAIRMLPDR